MVDDTLFIIDEQEKAIHALTRSSAAIWSLLQAPTSVHETKRLMRQAFPQISARRIASDMDSLFADLRHFKLISPVDSKTGQARAEN
jgi:hypothetical protein